MEDLLSDLSNPWVMLTFYRKLFPFKLLQSYLNKSHSQTRNFANREIAFTLRNDVYIRYQSFASHAEFKKECIRLNPQRFELGPVYSAKPKDRKMLLKTAFKPLRRELVFDIDMTDYDAVRTCCQDKQMCKRCWGYIVLATRVLDRILRDDFGFQHLLYVYSGRRGIHIWISDPSALDLTDDQRKAVVGYIEIVKGGMGKEKKVALSRPLHPSIDMALTILRTGFTELCLKDQEVFKTEEQYEVLLRLLSDKNIAATLRAKWAGKLKMTSLQRWEDVLAQGASGANDRVNQRYRESIADIILQYTYPRIDSEVSKHRNHLLKSPFCVHPGTGRVCVPLTFSQIESFDPALVPTVGKLLMELELVAAPHTATSSALLTTTASTSTSTPSKPSKPKTELDDIWNDAIVVDTPTAKKEVQTLNVNGSGSGVKGEVEDVGASEWEKTSLKPYIDLFRNHCEGIIKEEMVAKRDAANGMEF